MFIDCMRQLKVQFIAAWLLLPYLQNVCTYWQISDDSNDNDNDDDDDDDDDSNDEI